MELAGTYELMDEAVNGSPAFMKRGLSVQRTHTFYLYPTLEYLAENGWKVADAPGDPRRAGRIV